MKFWDNKGNIAVMASLTMPVVIGGAGFGVETGYWYYEQLHLQQAADAAAYAAALEHYMGNESNMLSGATNAATDNGFDSAADDIDMTWPSATYPSDERSVDIALSKDIPRGFTALFGSEPITVHVKATAKYEPSSNACLLALSKSASNAVWIHGNSTMNISGCVVSSNSLSSESINTQGSSSASMPCATSAGGVDLNDNTTLTECDEPLENQLPVADPYKDLPLPTPGACQNFTGNNHNPGTYCGDIAMHGHVDTFSPGTYIFNGGHISVNGGDNGGMTCTGCTFIFLNGAYMTMNGNPPINLQAPTTGTYAGMLFIGDRTGTPVTNIFNGSASSKMTGTIYFPNDPVQYAGNFAGFNGCTQVVALTIEWTGNTNLGVDCSAYGIGTIQVGGRPYLVG
ncbi:MAG TPA: pilus assembly protein TadG-related protein [Caulobacteraceae bacterium]